MLPLVGSTAELEADACNCGVSPFAPLKLLVDDVKIVLLVLLGGAMLADEI